MDSKQPFFIVALFALSLTSALVWFRARQTKKNVLPNQKLVETCWDSVIRQRYERWRATGKLEFPPKHLHGDLVNLIVVNDACILNNKPPPRFEDLTPIARQVLSGITPTVSTINGALLPSERALLASFQQLRQFSTLTEGGRALTKHCHRCSSKWWGDVKGRADEINAIALEKAIEILREATWRNVFYLPGNRPVCEFRVELGYGARWTWSPNEAEIVFRGFLEPPQENGHEVGWQH
jgi:hypothetical protein